MCQINMLPVPLNLKLINMLPVPLNLMLLEHPTATTHANV
jgi:hypothetical protein